MTYTSASTRVDDGGRTVGPYRIISLLGRGGMGEVHRAYDTRRGREVALKLLPATAGGDTFRERFRREADIAAGLREPHIVPIHDFGEIDGRLFIDMRLIDGSGLDSVIRAGALTPLRAVNLVTQVAQALDAAHAQGLVHRDVKPSNILVTASDFAYLVDFGIARAVDDETGMTTTGSAIGTAAYMAPERFDGGPPDRRSDVYALTCVLVECLLGRTPFEATSLPGQMKAHLLTDPPRPSAVRPGLPPAFDHVIATGMAKDPRRRFGSAGELAIAAAGALRSETAVMPTSGPIAWPHTSDAPRSTSDPAPVDIDARFASLRSQAEQRVAPRESPATPRRRWRRTKMTAAALAGIAMVGLVAFGAGRLSGDTATVAPVAAPSSAPVAAPTTAPDPDPVAPATSDSPSSNLTFGSGQASGYTYTVESNYPVYVGYTDANGDQINASSVPAPWTLRFSTERWGSDQRPSLTAFSMSSKGDTFVSCTVTDSAGKVLASDRKEKANAMTMCMVF